MKRIAQILGNMNGGGVEQMVLSYYQAIDRSQLQFDFYIFEGSKFVPYQLVEELGGRIIELPRFSHPIKYVKRLKKYLKSSGYDIVHCHLSTLSALPLFTAKLAGVPIRIVHNHSTSGGKREVVRNIAKAILKPFASMFATHRVACSEYASRWMYGKRRVSLLGESELSDNVIIPNAVDSVKYSFEESKRFEIRNEFNISELTAVYGHIGRFCPQKNHTFLVEIFAEILKIESDSRLVLVGTGEDLTLIREQCLALGILDKVIFAGQRNDADKFYCAFDCFVMPSNYEGLPVVGVEAQCSGVSCVFSDKITSEIMLCDNAQRLSLSLTAKQWAEVCVAASHQRNEDSAQQVCVKGFDIHEQGFALMKYYYGLIGCYDYTRDNALVMDLSLKRKKPLVSILMAVYKPNEKWLREQLISLNSQTYPNLELLIYDDCPEMPLDERIVQELIFRFPYRVIHGEKNLGSNKAFEILTIESNGDYVSYCDQDDIWHFDKVQRMVDVLNATGSSLVCSDLAIIDSEGKCIADSITKIRKRHVFYEGEGLVDRLLVRCFVTGCAMMMKSEIAKSSVPFVDSLVHDQWLAINAALKGRIEVIREPLIDYRQHNNNQTGILKGIYTKQDYFEARIDNMDKRIVDYKNRLLYFDEARRSIAELEILNKARIRYFQYHRLKDLKIMWKYMSLMKWDVLLETVLPFLPRWALKVVFVAIRGR